MINAKALIVKTGMHESANNIVDNLFTNGSDYKDAAATGVNSSSISFDSNQHNNLMNESLEGDNENFVPHILKCIVLVCIILLAIFSNLLVVISVFRYHKLRHINNYFLVSLAVADLMVACFAMTFNATVEITGQWNFGYRICDLWTSLDVHLSTVSTLHLCCIAVDRYFAIVKPLSYTTYMTVNTAALMIGVAWTAPTLISFLPIFMGWYTTEFHQGWRLENPNECRFRVNEPYAFISSTLTFWAPVIAMLFMYRRIYKEAVRQREHIRRSSVPSQQHLIVDSDSNRLRFQALQANGFRRGCNTSKAPPALPNPPIPPIKAPLTPPNSNDIIRHHQKSNRKETRETIDPSNSQDDIAKTSECETKFNGTNASDVTPIDDDIVPPPTNTPADCITSTSNSKCNNHNTTSSTTNMSASATNSPVRNTLTPTPTLLSNVQRRLSFANTNISNISEEITPFNLMTEAYPGATSVMGVWTLGLGLIGDPSSSFCEERDLTIQWNFVDHTLTENPENNKKYLNISQLVSQAVFGLSTNQKSIYTKREYRWYGRSQKKCLRERHRIHTSWRKEHKAFVTLGIVMGAFLLCWLPFFSWYLTVTICGEKNCPCPDIVVSILFWIGYFNSTLNPLIYVMTNRDFKDAFTDILRRIFCFCCPDCVCCSSNCCSCCFAEASNANPECAVNSNLDYV